MRPLEIPASAPAEWGCVPGTCGRDELPSDHNGLDVSGLYFGWSYISCMPRSQLVSATVASTHIKSLVAKRLRYLLVIPGPSPALSAMEPGTQRLFATREEVTGFRVRPAMNPRAAPE
jgi:hypothetical protein